MIRDFFAFRKMVTTTLIKIVYFLGVIGCFVVAAANPDTNLAITIAAGLLLNVVWRLICEFVIITFSIHEQLVAILKK